MNAVRKSVGVGLGFLGFLLATSSAEAQQYQYTFFSYPGAVQTGSRGISNDGAVVGSYFLTSSTSGPSGGYIYSGGTFEQVTPSSSGSVPGFQGVNDSGVAVGNHSGHAFEYSGGVYTPIAAPGAVSTRAIDINDSGDIVGSYQTSSGSHLGYVDVGGVFTTIAPPGVTIGSGSAYILASSISDNGNIAGAYGDATVTGVGFIDIDGVFATVLVPGSTYTGFLGINDSGVAVGYYGTPSGGELPFIDTGGVLTYPTVPGANQYTDFTGINNAGTISGYTNTPQGNLAAYIATPLKTLTNLLGGTPSDPVRLPLGAPIGDITGSIGGQGSTDFYKLSWSGGSFAATLSLTGANANSAYLFEILDAQGNVIETLTLDQVDGFSGTLSDVLAAGDYEIGLEADSPNDPAFNLQFATPVYGVPEPTTWAMLLVGLGGIGASLRSRRSRKSPPSAAPGSQRFA